MLDRRLQLVHFLCRVAFIQLDGDESDGIQMALDHAELKQQLQSRLGTWNRQHHGVDAVGGKSRSQFRRATRVMVYIGTTPNIQSVG